MRIFYFRLLVVAVFLLCVVDTPLLIAQRAVEIKGSDTEKSVRIQYIPGLSNSKKLANPFEETYSTLYLLQGEGGHSLFFESDHGVVMINTMAQGWGKPILETLELITLEPVTTIINTHPDAEYTGSNGEFPGEVTIVAHANTEVAMKKMAAFQGKNAKHLPNKTYTDKLSLFEGKNQVDVYHFGAAHTDGDSVAVVLNYGTAYLGDLFPAKATPVIDRTNGGSAVAFPETLARALDTLTALEVEYIVPGKAAPFMGSQVRLMSLKDLQEYVDFNRDFLAATKVAFQAGQDVDEAAASLTLPNFPDYDMEHTRANIQAIYDELQ